MSNPPYGQKRRLQIKLGRPKPPAPAEISNHGAANGNRIHPGRGSGSGSGGFRISLKRRPSTNTGEAPQPPSQDDGDDDDGDDAAEGVGTEEEQDQSQDESRTSSISGSIDGHQTRNDDDEEDDDEDEDEDEDQDDDDQESIGMRHRGQDEMENGNEDEGPDEEDHDDEADRPASHRAFDSPAHHPPPQQQSSNGSRPRPIKRLRSKGLYEALPKLIANLKRRDSYKFFWDPVDLDEVPNYLDFISHPMDLGTMEKKVQRRIYSHMDEFRRDFTLVVQNAQTFNPVGTLFHGEGKKLQNWGLRAIEREGMAVNDNGRAGVKGEVQKRQREVERLSSQDQTLDDTPSRKRPRRTIRMSTSGNAGLEALIDAARLKPGEEDRAVAALVMANAARSGRTGTSGLAESEDMEVEMKHEADDLVSEAEADDEVDDDEAEAVGQRSASLRERSATADLGGPSGSLRRLGSSRLRALSPSTPAPHGNGLLRGASPDSLRKRLATVTGTPLAAFANIGGAPAKSTPSGKIKSKHRLGPLGTPKRFAVSSSGMATPSSTGPAVANTAAAAAVAAQQIASSSSSLAAAYNFAPDGSIDPDDIEDLQSFFILRSSSRPILMPTIESLQPLPFVPQSHSDRAPIGTAGGKKKEKEQQPKETEREKEKEKEDHGEKDKDEKDGGADKDAGEKDREREKADKDPLSTLPPLRPGVPDALFAAIAPAPELYSANYSHDASVLPASLATLPFHVPSGLSTSKTAALSSISATERSRGPSLRGYENRAYMQALHNETRPKKLRDKEREKEKEYTEDWSHFRPGLTRLLEPRDLGLYSVLPALQSDEATDRSLIKAPSETEIAKAVEQSLTSSEQVGRVRMEDVLRAATATGLTIQQGSTDSTDLTGVKALAEWGEQTLRTHLWKGTLGEVYARSVAEFVQGSIESPFLWEEGDDIPPPEERSTVAREAAPPRPAAQTRASPEPEATDLQMVIDPSGPKTDGTLPSHHSATIDRAALLPTSLPDYVATNHINPLTGNLLHVLQLVHSHLSTSPSLDDPLTSVSSPLPADLTRLFDRIDVDDELERKIRQALAAPSPLH